MTISTLDPRSALILIDLQKGITGRAMAHPVAGVLDHAAALAKAFRAHDLPVVLVNVVGGAPGRTERTLAAAERPTDWADLVPELDQQPSDLLLTKRTWGAFHGTNLHALLTERGVTQVVLGGLVTSKGVESTARAAHEHGYHVTLVSDAMTDFDTDAHDASLRSVFPALGEVGTTDDVLDHLNRA